MIKKICIITPVHWSFGMGGIEYQVKLLVDSLLEHKNLQVFYLARKLDPGYSHPDYDLIRISKDSYLRRKAFSIDTRDLLRSLNTFKPDVIYQNGGCAYTGIAAYYAKKNGIRMIWHAASDHDLESIGSWSNLKPNKLLDKLILNWGIRNADVIIAQSTTQKQLIAQRNKKAEVHVIRNFHPFPDPNEQQPKKNQIVWVANLKPLKQPELYILLAKALAVRNRDVKCIMIGGPAAYPLGYQNKIETQMRDVKNLCYLGKLSQEQVNKVISQSKLLVNTSKWEGFPNTFIQAWMRKTPVVSLKVDPDNVLENHKCGVLSRNFEKMVEDVEDLLTNDAKRINFGKIAFEYSFQNHSLTNVKALHSLLLQGHIFD